MCGIAGIVSKNPSQYRNIAGKMISSLAHRGPDGEGLKLCGDCILGHRRLSIVDLKTGDQPMATPDEKITIVFNGEIYGYKDLRSSLDYPFQTSSDTEVILALYKKYGVNSFLEYLPGMFAFALWDSEAKKLVCARDRFGEKPFYYAFGKNGEFLFASEIKALLASDLFEPILDLSSVSHYLKHLYVHPRRTIYKNIFSLPPAHTLEYSNGKVMLRRYWHMPEISDQISVSDAVAEFKRLFELAVQKQLIADVPVGSFLSGGLDSSTVVAVASKYNPQIKTFSFAFRDSINELPFAKIIAEKYKTSHIELWDDAEPLGELLLQMQNIYDEPFGDSSNIPTYLISKLSRNYTKVALTGDGGDELLGGYGWYRPLLGNREKNIFDGILRSRIIGFAGKALRRIGSRRAYESVLHARAKSFPSIFNAHTCGQPTVFSTRDISSFNLPDANELEFSAPGWSLLQTPDDAMRADIENYMPGDILVKTDRAAMANSLELRAPFLDVDFASFCLSLPYRLKITDESDKIILRKAYSDLWGADISKRNKQGFGAPVAKWLGSDNSLRSLSQEYLSDSCRKIFSLIPFSAVKKINTRKNYQTWALLVLSLWLEKNNPKIEK